MLSRKNKWEYSKKYSDVSRKYCIKRIGLITTSVLIGITFMGARQNVLGDEVGTNVTENEVVLTTAPVTEEKSTDEIAEAKLELTEQADASQTTDQPETLAAPATVNTERQAEDDGSTAAYLSELAPPKETSTADTFSLDDWEYDVNVADKQIRLTMYKGTGPELTITGRVSDPRYQDYTVVAAWDVPVFLIRFLYRNAPTHFNILKTSDGKKVLYDNPHLSFSDIDVESLDLSGLDTSKVVNMHGAFDHMPYAKSLNLSGLDTHNVTDMSSMFWVSDKLEHLDLSSFDTSKVTDMSGMFFGMSGLKTLELGNFDTHNVTDMSSMFYSLYELKKLDVSHFDTSKVTDMESMFAHAESLEKLDVSHFNTSQVTDMRRMFANLPKLKELDVSNFDTRKVTDMSGMFSSMEELKELDLSNFETYNVRDMGSMFYETKNLEALNLSNFDISKLKDHSYSSDKPNVFAFDRSPKLRLVNLANLDISNSSEKVRASLAGALNNRQGAVAIVAKPEVFKLIKTDNIGTVIGPQYEAGEGRFQNGSATLNLVKSQNIDPAELYAALPTQTELANVESPVLAGYKLKNWSLISDEVDDLSRLGLKGYAPKFKTVRYQAAYEPLKETDAGIVTYVPKAKDLTVRVNEDPVAPEAISNKEELPSNTKYAWKEKVDTTTIGAKFGTLIVTYPNGAKEEVVVKITVIAADPVVDTTASKSELEQGSAKGFSPHIKQESDKAPAHTNASDEKQSLPQLGDANANLSLIAGVLVAGVASLLGASLIVNRKR